jgi:hypothetical protein
MSKRVNRDWAGASCRSSHVCNAPLATVGPKKAACREVPKGTGWRNTGRIGWQSPARISPTGYA